MAKQRTLEAVQAQLAQLNAALDEPARRRDELLAEIARLQAERDAAHRAEALARLPALEAPATVEAFKQAADSLVAKGVQQLTVLRDTLLQCDQLVEQQEAVAVLAQNAAAALNVPSSVRAIGRGLLKGMFLDALRDWGFFNAELYLSFPREVDRDNAILSAVGGIGCIPPHGMTSGECARHLLTGRTISELYSERAAAEREHAEAIKATDPPRPQHSPADWHGHRNYAESVPPNTMGITTRQETIQ